MLPMLLRTYMDMHQETVAGFAVKIGVREAAIYRYLGGRVPTRAVLARIVQVTGGQVLPNDFYQFVVAARCAIEKRT